MVFPFKKKKKDKENSKYGRAKPSPYMPPPPPPGAYNRNNLNNSSFGSLGPPAGPPPNYKPVIGFSPNPSMGPPRRDGKSKTDPQQQRPGHLQNQPRFGTDPMLMSPPPAAPDNSFSVIPANIDRVADPPMSLFSKPSNPRNRHRDQERPVAAVAAQPIPLPGMNAGKFPMLRQTSNRDQNDNNNYPAPPANLNFGNFPPAKPRGYLSPEDARDQIALNPNLPSFIKQHPPTIPAALVRSDLRRKRKKKKKKLNKFGPPVFSPIARQNSQFGLPPLPNSPPPPVPPKRGRTNQDIPSFGSTFFGMATTKRETHANKKNPMEAAPKLPPRKKLNPIKSRHMQKKLTRQFGNDPLKPPPLPPRPRRERKKKKNEFDAAAMGNFGNFRSPFPASSRFYG